jgi:hypothetical protein
LLKALPDFEVRRHRRRAGMKLAALQVRDFQKTALETSFPLI